MTPNGKCPTCGQRVGSEPGKPTPVHSTPDSASKKCPGGVTKPL